MRSLEHTVTETSERILRLALPYQQVEVTIQNSDTGQTMLSLLEVRTCIS